MLSKIGLSRWLDDRRGIALIEGSLILAFLVIVLLQTIVITQFYGANVRIDQAADGIANMVSQEREIVPAAITDFERAAAHFLQPYAPPDSLAVAQVVYRADGSPSVSNADGGWLLSAGTEVITSEELLAMAAGLGLAGEALIVVRLRHEDTDRLQFGPTVLPSEIMATAFAKTRSGRPVLVR